MARPKVDEEAKHVGLHTSIPPKLNKALELIKKKKGTPTSFVVTQALEAHPEVKAELERLAS